MQASHTKQIRLLQIILIVPVFLREAINTITDIEYYGQTLDYIRKVATADIQAPTIHILNRHLDSPLAWNVIAVLWIIAHAAFALLLLAGLIQLVQKRNAPAIEFIQAKSVALWGLVLTIAWYFITLGFFMMDYFLYWQIDGSIGALIDLINYGLPPTVALFFLLYQPP